MPVSDKIAVQVDGRDLTLTNLAKVLYPADGFTKAEVLDYYQRVSAVLRRFDTDPYARHALARGIERSGEAGSELGRCHQVCICGGEFLLPFRYPRLDLLRTRLRRSCRRLQFLVPGLGTREFVLAHADRCRGGLQPRPKHLYLRLGLLQSLLPARASLLQFCRGAIG